MIINLCASYCLKMPDTCFPASLLQKEILANACLLTGYHRCLQVLFLARLSAFYLTSVNVFPFKPQTHPYGQHKQSLTVIRVCKKEAWSEPCTNESLGFHYMIWNPLFLRPPWQALISMISLQSFQKPFSLGSPASWLNIRIIWGAYF